MCRRRHILEDIVHVRYLRVSFQFQFQYSYATTRTIRIQSYDSYIACTCGVAASLPLISIVASEVDRNPAGVRREARWVQGRIRVGCHAQGWCDVADGCRRRIRLLKYHAVLTTRPA